MRRFITGLVISTLLFIIPTTNSEASLGGIEDYSNPRIVPIYNHPRTDVAAFSAFLYSPRILLTVAHSEYYFDNNGNRIYWSPLELYAGLPNSKAVMDSPRVKVIKRIISTSYRFDGATLGDFAVYVLERDLADVKPAKLLTPEIAAELVSQNVDVNMHGYGAYTDSCSSGQKVPCANNIQERSKFPRLLTAKFNSLSEVEKIVGYQRPQLKSSLTFFRAGKESLCSGDSGGSTTVNYKGELLYLSATPNGMNAYGCGASSDFDGIGGILYSSPVYDHLDIIKEAEEFVSEQLKLEAASRVTPTPTPSPKVSIQASTSPSPGPTTKSSVSAKPKISSTTITCVKGKVIKKVTSINPKCPAGFRKK